MVAHICLLLHSFSSVSHVLSHLIRVNDTQSLLRDTMFMDSANHSTGIIKYTPPKTTDEAIISLYHPHAKLLPQYLQVQNT